MRCFLSWTICYCLHAGPYFAEFVTAKIVVSCSDLGCQVSREHLLRSMEGASLPSTGSLNSLRYLCRAQLTSALSLCALKSNSHLERVVLQTSVACCILQFIKFLWSICSTMLSAFLSSQPASELEKWGKTVLFHWISLVTAGSSLASSHLFMKFLTSTCLYLKLHTLLFMGQSHEDLCHDASAFRGHFPSPSQVR